MLMEMDGNQKLKLMSLSEFKLNKRKLSTLLT